MKRYATLILLAIALLSVSCTRPNVAHLTPDPSLAVIDSLMWIQPDSAFSQLQSFAESHEVDSLNAFNGHYFHLLLSELLYKNDYAQTNRDELLQAVDYYDSLVAKVGSRADADLLFLDARAHYIYGVGYYEMDSAVQACQQYLTAVETMEERFSEKELAGEKAQFLALAYTRLIDVYSDQYLHDQAIYFGKKTLEYFRRYDAPQRYIGWALLNIGMHYDIIEKYNEAGVCYKRALEYVSDTNSMLYRDIVSHLAYLSYEKRGHPQESLTQLASLLASAENEKEQISRCLTIGELYYHEKEYDSAKVYLGCVFENGSNLASKKQAAEWLADICKDQNEPSLSARYAEYLIPFANYEENRSAKRTTIIKLYEKHLQSIQDKLYQQKKKRNVLWTLVLMGSLLIPLVVFVINNHISKNKRKHLELKNEALSHQLKKGNKKLRELKEQLNNNKKDIRDYNSFLNTPICRHILEAARKNVFKSKMDHACYQEFELSKEQVLALRIAADESMDDFTVRLRKHFPSLNDEDVTYCCLYLLKLNDAQVAAFMQRAYPTVCERKRKIKRLLGEDKDLTHALLVLR